MYIVYNLAIFAATDERNICSRLKGETEGGVAEFDERRLAAAAAVVVVVFDHAGATLSPTEARQLARQLGEAARYADGRRVPLPAGPRPAIS